MKDRSARPLNALHAADTSEISTLRISIEVDAASAATGINQQTARAAVLVSSRFLRGPVQVSFAVLSAEKQLRVDHHAPQ
jgi:hypothetical protein